MDLSLAADAAASSSNAGADIPTAATSAAAVATARAESVAAAQLMTQTALGVGARRVSVPVRAAPLDVFLTLMAALDGGGSAVGTGSRAVHNGGGNTTSGGSGNASGQDRVLASSVFRAVLGRSVASVDIVDKVCVHCCKHLYRCLRVHVR